MTSKITYHGIGLMSGSSLDGLDIALCKVDLDLKTKTVEMDLLQADCVALPTDLQDQLAQGPQLELRPFLELDATLGQFMATAVHQFLERLPEVKVDFIASHGHTIIHDPAKGYSCQIGSAAQLAAQTGLTTISDFRNIDIALGGQGAPMAPLIDQVLYHADVCVNIGGIANLSYSNGVQRVGFDFAPANQLLNYLSAKLGSAYDDQGKIAQSGQVHDSLLQAMLAVPMIVAAAPKSFDNTELQAVFLPILNQSNISIADQLATCVELIAITFKHCMEDLKKVGTFDTPLNVLFTGGGAKNDFLIHRMMELCSVDITRVKISAEESDMKEAMLMVLAGAYRLSGIPNLLSSVTGSAEDNMGGAVYQAKAK